jgi:hypothetical protein
MEYANGCTNSGYLCSTATVAALCVSMPLLHYLYFSDPPPAPLARCLKEATVSAEAHAAALSLYFRYGVVSMQQCNLETRILRGCVADGAQVVRFMRYPPGPLRSKNARDIEKKFAYIQRDYLGVRSDLGGGVEGSGGGGTDGDGDGSNAAAGVACAKPGSNFAHLLPRLTSLPYSVSLRHIPPFSSILSGLGDAEESSSKVNNASTSSASSAFSASSSSPPPLLLRYVDYACLAAVEHTLKLLDAATEAGTVATPPFRELSTANWTVDLSHSLPANFSASVRCPRRTFTIVASSVLHSTHA